MMHAQQLLQRQQLRSGSLVKATRRSCFTARCPARRIVRASAESDQAAKMQAMQEALKNPEVRQNLPTDNAILVLLYDECRVPER
jgi:hypothetical protein